MTENTGESKSKFEIVEEYRKQQIEVQFPELRRDDKRYTSDKDYIDALRAQTIAIRNREWEIVSSSVCIGAYNKYRAMTVKDAKSAVFSKSGSTGGMQLEDIPDDQSWRMEMNVAKTPTVYSAEMIGSTWRHLGIGENQKTDMAHCAQTSSLNIYAMAGAMGLPNPVEGAEVASALGIHKGQDKGSAICGGDYSGRTSGRNNVSLGSLVKDGVIGPGSVVSYCTKPNPKGTYSGYHAMTIASVNRDENGEIISYTVMDNNGGGVQTRLQTIGIDENHKFNNLRTYDGKKPLYYTNVGNWANDQITQRYDDKFKPMYDDGGNFIGMNGKVFQNEQEKEEALSQMKQFNQDARTAVYYEIDELANREKTLLTDTEYTKSCEIGRVSGLINQQNKLVEYYDKQVAIAQLGSVGFDIKAQKDLNTQLSEEVGEKEADLSEFTERYDACEEDLTALAQREDELSQSVVDVNTQAMTGREERPKKYERRMERYKNITGEYNNLNEDYGTELASINADISTVQVNYDSNMQNIEDRNESIEQLKQRNAELQEEVKGKTDPSSKIEGAREILSNEQSIGENIQAKGASIEGVGANVTDMEGLAERKGGNISAQEEVVDNYQMVVDYATLSRREIREKYGITRKELKERLDALEAGKESDAAVNDNTNTDEKSDAAVKGNANTDEGFAYTEEEKDNVEEKMEEQVLEAEEKFNENVADINAGTYGSAKNPLTIRINEQEQEVSEQSAVDDQSKDDLKRITWMQGKFSEVKLDPALVDTMVEKYGVEVAYDLALTSMTNPAKVCKGADGKWRNSKACLNYFLENEVSDEVIARVTGREVADVHSKRMSQVRSENTVLKVEMNPALRDKLYEAPSL